MHDAWGSEYSVPQPRPQPPVNRRNCSSFVSLVSLLFVLSRGFINSFSFLRGDLGESKVYVIVAQGTELLRCRRSVARSVVTTFFFCCGKCDVFEGFCRLLLSNPVLADHFLDNLSWAIDFPLNLLGFLMCRQQPPIIHANERGLSNISAGCPLLFLFHCMNMFWAAEQ